jgi:hypothetical protein
LTGLINPNDKIISINSPVVVDQTVNSSNLLEPNDLQMGTESNDYSEQTFPYKYGSKKSSKLTPGNLGFNQTIVTQQKIYNSEKYSI